MPPKKEIALPEGLSLNLTCRFRKGPKNPITWQKNGVDLNPNDQNQSAKITETEILSMLMLTNITQSDAGNYSCQSMKQSGPISQWIYIYVKDKYGDLNGSRTVADEPHSKSQGFNRKQPCADPSGCKPKNPNSAGNQPTVENNNRIQELAGNDLPIGGSTEPYAFLLDNVGELQNSDDYIGNIQLTENCETSSEGCADRLGNSTAIIGIGTMCSLFFIAVIVSAFFIRRKILRQQRRVFRLQQQEIKNAASTVAEEHISMETIPPDQERVPIINTASQHSGTLQEVIYFDRPSNVGDVVYIPNSAVFEQRCSCIAATTSSQPLLVPLAGTFPISQDSIHSAKGMLEGMDLDKSTSRTPD
ncbi:hypothetical protein Aperf_G00000118625 [Anoplocephala perfoliata]